MDASSTNDPNASQGSPENNGGAPDDAGSQDAGISSDADISSDAEPDSASPATWTQGHGDLRFAFDPANGDGTLRTSLHIENGTLNEVQGISGTFSVEEIVVQSSAQFTRPELDNDLFDPLCVSPGERLPWIPQRNTDAAALGAPFFGLLAEIDTGVFIADELTLELLTVHAPAGGAYSLWRDGFPPTFFFSSCDGIDDSDIMTLPIGHDHFNMGFTEGGRWLIEYRASGELVESGRRVATSVTVEYLLQ